MNRKENIALSFFSLDQQDFDFTIYRRVYREGETKDDYPDCIRYNLPKPQTAPQNSPDYISFWLSYKAKDGFDAFLCTAHTNNFLTIDFLFRLLKEKCEGILDASAYEEASGFNKRRISFVLAQFTEGYQAVWLEPYYLRVADKFGFLADFKFEAPPDAKSSRRLQQLSLSLDKGGRSNLDFYVDRFEQLKIFLATYHKRLFPLQIGDLEIGVEELPMVLQGDSLDPKQYVFARNRVGTSQFKGIQTHGPLNAVPNNVKIYFLYREKDKSFSHELFRALRGDTFRNIFPGMERMFGFRFDGTNVNGAAVEDFTPKAIEKALAAIREDATDRRIVPILLTPFNRFIGDPEHEKYYGLKYAFLRQRVASQFVSLILLQQKNQLKWSVGNIGLQLFAKMGGEPWKVVPKTENCLIVGIGQAHKEKNDEIEKYFAYSILTESTGIYKELRILGEAGEKGDYLQSFKRNLRNLFEQYYDDYESFVVHATFSIRWDELDALKDVLTTLQAENGGSKRFIAMKFNDRNKFFAYAVDNNSLVPYESSFLRLSDNEFLIWFEGLQYHNPNIRKRFERPLHVEFIYPETGLDSDQQISFLQDAVNISGANWRGFNAKSLPVSVYYAHLVAEYYSEFEALGLEEINLEAIHPWFL